MKQTYTPREMIEKLIGIPTVSRDSNLELINFVSDYLGQFGVECRTVANDIGDKANLYATIGPAEEGGIVLSGHTDVVPIDGQPWDTDPFSIVEKDGKLYGRGTCDMKSFYAIALARIPEMLEKGIKKPIHFALSYDEEVGCLGAPAMIEEMVSNVPRPSAVIVGEPTDMKVVVRHKGIMTFEAFIRGHEVHSSQQYRGVSAVMTAGRMIDKLRQMQEHNKASSDPDNGFVPHYTTLHVGQVRGGTAHNITARDAWFVCDIRVIAGQLPMDFLEEFKAWIEAEIVPEMQAVHPDTGVRLEPGLFVPGLDSDDGEVAVQLAKQLTGENSSEIVAYATEAGQFQQAGYSVVICGPGSIDQAHQPNEFITLDQVSRGTAFIDKLIDRLVS